jgi:hypothetical protein
MEQNRYELPGGDFDFEDLRRQRIKDYAPITPGDALQQKCENVVDAMDELLYRSLMHCDITSDMARVELAFAQSEGYSCVKRQLRRIAKPENDGSMYVLTRETIDLSAPKRPTLLARHYGMTTTQLPDDAGRVYNISKWQVPNVITRHEWLGGISLSQNRHEISNFDFTEILDDLTFLGSRVQGLRAE